jgi:hypothetical protein
LLLQEREEEIIDLEKKLKSQVGPWVWFGWGFGMVQIECFLTFLLCTSVLYAFSILFWIAQFSFAYLIYVGAAGFVNAFVLACCL